MHRRHAFHPLASLVLLFAGACAGGQFLLPEQLLGVPDPNDAYDSRIVQARQLQDTGDTTGAMRIVDQVLAEKPAHVDAARTRQDLLRRRGRLGLLLYEAEQRVAAAPHDSSAQYLRGRIVTDPAEKRECFARALALEPRSFWAWLGLAFSLRSTDLAQSLQIYAQLYAKSGEHPTAGTPFIAALREARKLESALVLAQKLRQRQDQQGVGAVALAETLVLLERVREGWTALLEALKLRPFDPEARRLLGHFIARGIGDEEVLVAWNLLRHDPERLARFLEGGGATMLAAVAQRLGNPIAARLLLEGDKGQPPKDAPVRRVWRRLLLATGDAGRFLADLREQFPPALLADPANTVRERWQALFSGPWYASPDPLAQPAEGLALAQALVRCGFLQEAEMLLDSLWLRHRELPGPWRAGRDDLQKEVRRELAFEGALQRVLYHGYSQTSAPRDLEAVLGDLRRISKEHLGVDVVGTPPVHSAAFLGVMLDPFAGTFAEHLARYNRHLVLGQRSGRPVEGLLVTRLAVRPLVAHELLPGSGRGHEVIGENREIRSLTGVYGGDLAGVALFEHYVIDYDSVREWADNLRERRRIAREDGSQLLRDPLPAGARPLDPVDVDWRLNLVSREQDSDLDAAVLDMIRWHEHGHLIDSFHFLPFGDNVWRCIGLLLRNGFSPAAIEADLEGRAETVALALSPHTQLVLGHIAGFLDGEEAFSTHVGGFRELARRVLAGQEARGAPAPKCCRWHELEPAAAVEIAREVLRSLW